MYHVSCVSNVYQSSNQNRERAHTDAIIHVPHLCGAILFQDPPTVTFEYGVDEDGLSPQPDGDEAVVVESPQLPLSVEQMEFIQERFDPLHDDNNHGINNYVRLVNFISLVLQTLQ